MRKYQAIWPLLAVVAFAACDRKPSQLSLVKPLDQANQDVASDIVGLIDRESAVTIKFTGRAMSEADAIEALIAGDADIALVSNSMPFRRRIATVLPMYPNVLHMGSNGEHYNGDGPISLQGAKINAGAPGSASRMMFETSRSHLNLGPTDFTYVDPLSDGSDPHNAPDVFVVFAPVARDNLDKIPKEYRDKIRFISMGTPADIGSGSRIDAMLLLNPHLDPFVIPVGTYGVQPMQPVLTLAVDMLLVARTDLDATIVYDLVHELLRLRPALAAMRPGLFSNLGDSFDSNSSTFVLHPGLLAYEQRDAPTVYERYSGIAEVVVTLFVALVSAAFAGTRMYRYARKNRIDAYYARAIEIRNAINESDSPEQRAQAVEKLKALQNEAFAQLIDEKLAADESFRIFIALSNDVLYELTPDARAVTRLST